MLRDAAAGKLPDIPGQVMDTEIEDAKVWECTRLVISDDVTGRDDRSLCLSLIVDGLVTVAARKGGQKLISLSPVTLMRALRQLGYSASRIGKTYSNAADGRKYAVLTMPAVRAGEIYSIAA